MCNHESGQLTLRHQIDRTYSADGEQLGEMPLGVDRVTWYCPACDVRGSGVPSDPGGMPRWVSERLATLPAAR